MKAPITIMFNCLRIWNCETRFFMIFTFRPSNKIYAKQNETLSKNSNYESCFQVRNIIVQCGPSSLIVSPTPAPETLKILDFMFDVLKLKKNVLKTKILRKTEDKMNKFWKSIFMFQKKSKKKNWKNCFKTSSIIMEKWVKENICEQILYLSRTEERKTWFKFNKIDEWKQQTNEKT